VREVDLYLRGDEGSVRQTILLSKSLLVMTRLGRFVVRVTRSICSIIMPRISGAVGGLRLSIIS